MGKVHVLGTHKQDACRHVLLMTICPRRACISTSLVHGTWNGEHHASRKSIDFKYKGLGIRSFPRASSFRNCSSIRKCISVSCHFSYIAVFIGAKAVQIPHIPLVVSPNRRLDWALPCTNAKQVRPSCQ